ncbi:MAG TPA: tetratricopeptide repeat protein, partial [Anaerolineae bacterium]|nr:tetratricopeptide repeat protein [Anaerolineae bacterium]
MTNETPTYDQSVVRDLLLASFTSEDLWRFCEDHAQFRPIAAEFHHSESLQEMVVQVITFCEAEGVWNEFLTAVREARPLQFIRYEPQLRVSPSEEAEPEPQELPPDTGPLSLPDPDVLSEVGELPPGSRLPFLRNIQFTGRSEAFRALVQAMLRGNSTSISVTQREPDPGGMGKTQLAIEFAYRYGRFFQGVHWLNSLQPDGIAAEVAACGAAMKLMPWPQELPKKVEWTLDAWRRDRRRLIILDNLQNGEAAVEWLRRLRESGAHLLVTTLCQDWPDDLGLFPVPLDPFTSEESQAFLRHYLPYERATDEEVETLAQKIGGLPLSLSLAGSCIQHNPDLTISTYMKNLEDALTHPSMDSWVMELGSPKEDELRLIETFAVSWDQVNDQQARRIFSVAGWCAPNQPIPPVLLAAATESQASLDAGAPEARAETYEGAITLLTSLGLLQMDDPADGPVIHPLLARYARTVPAEPLGERTLFPLQALADALTDLAGGANETGQLALFAPLRPHVESAAVYAEAADMPTAGDLWNHLGRHLRRAADYAGARAAFSRALALDQALLGPDHPDIAIRFSNLGSMLQNLNDLDGARGAFEQAMAIDEAALGPEHPAVARDANNLGSVLQAMG